MIGTLPTADVWSISPAGPCPSNIPRLSKNIWPSARRWEWPTFRTWAGCGSRGPARPSFWPNCSPAASPTWNWAKSATRSSPTTPAESSTTCWSATTTIRTASRSSCWWSTPAIARRSSIGSPTICRKRGPSSPARRLSGTTSAGFGRCSPSKGRKSVELLQPLVDVDLQSMRYYRGAQALILHPAAKRQGCIISRTGYTGEDGFEVSLGAGIAAGIWEALMEIGKPLGVMPAGLGARDTLRLEAGMPLYGHELSEEIDPFQAGLGFACHLVGYNFPGRDALLRIQKQPPKLVRIGLEMSGKRAARPGCADHGRRAEGRRSHQRQLFAHARQSHRHGLRRPRVLASRARNCTSTSAAATNRPASSNSRFTAARRKETRNNVPKTAVRQNARMGPRRERSGRRKDRHRRPDRLRPGNADRPGPHRVAQGRHAASKPASRSARSNRSRPSATSTARSTAKSSPPTPPSPTTSNTSPTIPTTKAGSSRSRSPTKPAWPTCSTKPRTRNSVKKSSTRRNDECSKCRMTKERRSAERRVAFGTASFIHGHCDFVIVYSSFSFVIRSSARVHHSPWSSSCPTFPIPNPIAATMLASDRRRRRSTNCSR